MKYYAKSHEWVKVVGTDAYIGISAHAADELGDLTFVELPEVGTDLIIGERLGAVESVKAASDVYSPISGTVVEVNTTLDDDAGIINADAEGEGWICKMSNIDEVELEQLLDEKAYQKLIG